MTHFQLVSIPTKPALGRIIAPKTVSWNDVLRCSFTIAQTRRGNEVAILADLTDVFLETGLAFLRAFQLFANEVICLRIVFENGF